MAPLHDHLAALERALPDLTPADLPEAIQRLAAAQAALAARLVVTGREMSIGAYLTIEEATKVTRLGKSTIRAKIAARDLVEGVHFTRKGRRLIFFQQALEDWMKMPAARAGHVRADEAVPIIPRRRGHG